MGIAMDTDLTAKLVDVYPPSVDYPEGSYLLYCVFPEGHSST